MNNVITLPIQSKRESHKYLGHIYTLSFVPGAHESERWQWHVRFTRTYDYFGSAETQQKASNNARSKLRALVGKKADVG